MCRIEKKQKEYGKEIFLIADEPYRELVYSDVKVPYLMNYYDNTIVCYSYSKSLSLPVKESVILRFRIKQKTGNRFMRQFAVQAVPLDLCVLQSLFQKIIARCIDNTEISIYEKTETSCNRLDRIMVQLLKPDRCFYFC